MFFSDFFYFIDFTPGLHVGKEWTTINCLTSNIFLFFNLSSI